MAVVHSLSWKFPGEKLFMRIEIAFISLLAVIILILSSTHYRSVLIGLLFTLIFLVLYFLVAYITKHVYKVEQHYEINSSHLHLKKISRGKTTTQKVPIKHVRHHKLDKFFLGGYFLTKQGKKHVLFFNAKDEVERFEKFLKKHLKPA